MQAEVTHGTLVCWPPKFRASMSQQLYLSEILFELLAYDIKAYTSRLPIHENIHNEFLTCTCEAGDPILSQNINRKYVVPNAK